MDNPNTNIMHETQNGDKHNKKQLNHTNASREWTQLFILGGGGSDKRLYMLLIGMSNYSDVSSILLKRDKTNS
jgi:hypothetical protein